MPRMSLAGFSTAALQREIERRRSQLPKLIAARDELNRRIADLEGAAAPEPPCEPAPAKKAAPKRSYTRRKPTGRLSLNDALTQVLTGKEAVSVPEATEGILALGYQTRSKNPQHLVKQTLYHYGDIFKRVGKGLFALKG